MTTTHIRLRRASSVRTTYEALTTGPRHLVQEPDILSWASAGFRVWPRCLPWHEFQCLPGFLPFQRHHQDHATAGIPAPVLPAPRFSQPLSEPTCPRLAGLFHPAGTPRVRPSEPCPRSIGARFPALAPPPLATSQGFHPVVRSALIRGTTPRSYALGPYAITGSLPLAGPASLSGFARP
jgi:hypothetical protein